jgi:hypothetical protein
MTMLYKFSIESKRVWSTCTVTGPHIAAVSALYDTPMKLTAAWKHAAASKVAWVNIGLT